jgi:hypothetical protein
MKGSGIDDELGDERIMLDEGRFQGGLSSLLKY